MRLIQFNSGLRVILKDVQETDRTQRRYIPLPPIHYSSNSSIATTSSSIKSNLSISNNHEYYNHRQYMPLSHSKIYYNHVKTPPVMSAIPPSAIIIEVRII